MPEPQSMPRNRDLVLPPRTQAFVLDTTKGKVLVYVGPSKTSLSDTDRLVSWNRQKRQFFDCGDTSTSTMNWAEAAEGQYIVLHDPSADPARPHPVSGNSTEAVDLSVGRKIIIPGPVTFPLFPGQTADTIDGHRLATNQYVIVRVCQLEEAKKNWEKDAALLASNVADVHVLEEGEEERTSKSKKVYPTLATGQLFIIKGTDVPFYIPSTGLEVVPDSDGNFVRNAATLEQLEYSILLDENGMKRYVHGPSVVFPEPTESFIANNNQRKFQAIELSPQSGIYVKVTAEYEENGITHAVGEELFITGDKQPFYFPRAEHNVIKYGDQLKHHAIAIPEGEGRYVLDRLKGSVRLVRGPQMFLPNPITEVIVKRILDAETVKIMYPGNTKAFQINEQLRAEEASRKSAVQSMSTRAFSHSTGASAMYMASAAPQFDAALFGDKTTDRGTAYSEPRSVVLDTKYDGAVAVDIWSGYAVCIANKQGKRRVVVGPQTVLLEYDESLAVMELSTGTPKTDRNLLKTCYLRVNNSISDIVTLVTSDFVQMKLHLSYRALFDDQQVITTPDEDVRLRWFFSENYVKDLTDRFRSVLTHRAKQKSIRELYKDAATFVKEALLRVDNAAEMLFGNGNVCNFEHNNMVLYDVEVLHVEAGDSNVARLFEKAAFDTLADIVQTSREQDRASQIGIIESLKRTAVKELDLTAKVEAEIQIETAKREQALETARVGKEQAVKEALAKVDEIDRSIKQANADLQLSIMKDRNDIEVARLEKETELRNSAMQHATQPIIQALVDFGDKAFVEKVAEALGPAALASGQSTAELLSQIFKGSPFASTLETLGKRPATAIPIIPPREHFVD